jgi:hypothetical protein
MIVQVGNQSSVAGSFHPSQAGKSEWFIKAISAE